MKSNCSFYFSNTKVNFEMLTCHSVIDSNDIVFNVRLSPDYLLQLKYEAFTLKENSKNIQIVWNW